MLLHELVKTASMRVELWRERLELRQLQREFPPRKGASPFWPALLLVVAGVAIFLMTRRPPLRLARPVPLVHVPRSDPDELLGRQGTIPVDFGEEIFLAVVSEPLGAQVEATWKGGSRSGVTPFSIEVPQGATVHLVFSKHGETTATDVIADAPQTVKGLLPRANAARPVGDFPSGRMH